MLIVFYTFIRVANKYKIVSITMLNIVMLSVIILSVVAPFKAVCRIEIERLVMSIFIVAWYFIDFLTKIIIL